MDRESRTVTAPNAKELAKKLTGYAQHLCDALDRASITYDIEHTQYQEVRDLREAAAELRRLAGVERELKREYDAHQMTVGTNEDLRQELAESRARVAELEKALREIGACGRCGGDGEESYVVDDGLEVPYEAADKCPGCDGTGLEPEVREALAPSTKPEPR